SRAAPPGDPRSTRSRWGSPDRPARTPPTRRRRSPARRTSRCACPPPARTAWPSSRCRVRGPRHTAPGPGRSSSVRRCSAACRGTCRRTWWRSSSRDQGGDRDERFPREREALLELAALERTRDALYVVEAVERCPRPADADETARLEQAAVAQDVERAAAG